jgi:hypothetical protein
MTRPYSEDIRERALAWADAGETVRSIAEALQISCACRKLNPGILVMQSVQGWATKNVPGAIDGARDQCIFLQG